MSAPSSPSDQPSVAFPSFAALRATHADLLRRSRSNAESVELLPDINDFVVRGQAAGALIDTESERLAAQSLLDYWSSVLERSGAEPWDAALADFDPSLAPELDDSLCPYLGLDAFRESQHGLFFGRRRIIDDCVGRLQHTSLLAVVGPSGSGKSSLVLGGLLPRLREGAVTGSNHWRYFASLAPGSDPLAALAATVLPPGPPELTRVADHVARLREDPGHLAELVGAGADTSALLVVDQFEEVFTLCDNEADRNAFIDNLLSLIQTPRGARQTVILTMRSDFESFVMRVPALQALFAASRVEVPALTGTELREAVEAPAELVGLKFEEGLVDELIKQLVGEPAALPLLQFTLLKLWKTRERNRITKHAFEKLGDGRTALANSADEFYNALPYEDQVCAKTLLLRMVQPGEGKETTSHRVRRSQLNLARIAEDRVERVLNKLVEERLVRETRVNPDEVSPDDQFEVAHEALVRNWPKLNEWLDEERVRIRRRLRLTATATQWRAAGGDPALLLRGSQLDEARGFEGLNTLEAEFVRASEAAIEEEQRQKDETRQREIAQAQELARERARTARRLQRWLTVTLAACVATIALGAVAFSQFQRADGERAMASANADLARANADQALAQKAAADQARNEAVGNQSSMLAQDQPDLGLLLGMEAYAASNSTADALAHLVSAVDQSRNRGIRTYLRGHLGGVQSVAFSPDGKLLASGGFANQIFLWDPASGAPVGPPLVGASDVNGYNTVSSVAFSPNGQLLAAGHQDGTIVLWDVAARSQIGAPLRLGRAAIVWSVAFSPDGQQLASGTTDRRDDSNGSTNGPVNPNGAVQLWDLRNLSFVEANDLGSIYAVAFSPDGREIAGAGLDKDATYATIHRWDASDGTVVGGGSLSQLANRPGITSIAYSPDRSGPKLIASTSGNAVAGTVSIWSGVDTDKPSRFQLGEHNGGALHVAFSPDGKLLASSGQDRAVQLWDVDTNRPLGRPLVAQQLGVGGVAFSPDSNLLASASFDGTVVLWDTPAGMATRVTFAQYGEAGQDTAVDSMAYSPDGQHLAASGGDGSIEVWRVSDGPQSPPEWRSPKGATAWTLAYSPDGNVLASGTEDGDVVLWDANTGQQLGEKLQGHTKRVRSVAFSSDGQTLASGSEDDTIQLWDVATRQPRGGALQAHQNGVMAVAFSPSGTIFASGGLDGSIYMWDAASGHQTGVTLTGHTASVVSLAFSPNGQTLASGGDDRTVRLSDPLTGEQKGPALVKHTQTVFDVAFSADGRVLASASADNTLILWDALTGRELGLPMVGLDTPSPYPGPSNWVRAVAFAPDGRRLAAAEINGRILAWNLDAQAVRAAACQTANRNLTPTEWARFLPGQTYRQTCPDISVPAYATGAVVPHAESLLAVGTDESVQAARAAFQGAVESVAQTKSLELDNHLCWTGSLDNVADVVMPACDRGVSGTTDKNRGFYTDGRAIARALLGDYSGALDDLQASLSWLKDNDKYERVGRKREAWIAALQAGQMPFTKELLQALHDETV